MMMPPRLNSFYGCQEHVFSKEHRKKAEYYEKTYGITPEMHQPFEVVDIINITVAAKDGEEAWSSDRCAEYWSLKLKIKNPGDRKQSRPPNLHGASTPLPRSHERRG